jgi:hypothetical protein
MEWQEILIPLIMAILTIIVFPLFREWLKSIKDERKRKLAEAGVHIAEQMAKRYAKENGLGKPMTGDDKKQVAITATMKLAQKAGLKVERELIEELIEAVLGAVTLKNGEKNNAGPE